MDGVVVVVVVVERCGETSGVALMALMVAGRALCRARESRAEAGVCAPSCKGGVNRG